MMVNILYCSGVSAFGAVADRVFSVLAGGIDAFLVGAFVVGMDAASDLVVVVETTVGLVVVEVAAGVDVNLGVVLLL